ncbi:hypothetical protein ACO2FM_03490 [Staphylococcus pasteuri]
MKPSSKPFELKDIFTKNR